MAVDIERVRMLALEYLRRMTSDIAYSSDTWRGMTDTLNSYFTPQPTQKVHGESLYRVRLAFKQACVENSVEGLPAQQTAWYRQLSV
jgi:hypothetical protein